MTTTTQSKYTGEVKLSLSGLTLAERVRLEVGRRNHSITSFAKTLRKPRRHRNTVSQAINHPDYFPHVVAQIKKNLGIEL